MGAEINDWIHYGQMMDGWMDGSPSAAGARVCREPQRPSTSTSTLISWLKNKHARRPRPSVSLFFSPPSQRGRGGRVRGLFDSDWHFSMFALATYPLDQTTAPLREEDIPHNLPTLLISLTLISHLSHLHHNPLYSLCSRSPSIL